MKKFLVLGLILAVAGGAFAQVSFTGNIEGGYQIRIPDQDNTAPADEPNMAFYHTGDYTGARVNLNASGSNADGNAGYVFGFRFNGITSDGTVTPNVTNAYAWYDFMDGMLRIVGAGRGGPGGFGLGGAYDASFDVAAGNNHLSFILKPMDELAIGFTVRAGIFENARYGLGLTYTIPEVARIAGLFEYNNERINLGAGVSILALADAGFTKLGIDVQYLDVSQVQEYAGIGKIEISTLRISQAATWVQDALTVGVDFRQQLLIGDDVDIDKTYVLRFGGFVSYALENGMVPRLDFQLGLGAVPNNWWRKPGDFVRGDIGLYGITGNTTTGTTAAQEFVTAANRINEDAITLGINPNVTIPLGGASFELGALLNFDLTDKAEPNAQQAIYFNYTLSF